MLVTIYATLPASGIPGSAMQTRNQAVAYYQQVADQVNPQPQASLYQDLEESHLLNFGLLYAVDFFANNLSGAATPGKKADHICKERCSIAFDWNSYLAGRSAMKPQCLGAEGGGIWEGVLSRLAPAG